MPNREPRCVMNHDVYRRALRDNKLPSMICPACRWRLSPAKEEHVILFTDEQEARIKELIWEELKGFGLIDRSAEDE